jgi:3-oxoacyl-[acyl-carrier protein] reductase
MVEYGLSGKVALVTGGSRGIGRAIAGGLLRAGCRVAILSVHADSVETGRQALAPLGEVMAIQADVTRRADVERAVRMVVNAQGSLDILVNNAGITSRSGLLQMTEAHWDEVMATNVKSLLLTCQTVVPIMMQKRWGRIINASSYAAWHAALNRGVYSASKAAVVALTRVWAGELAPYGITVNAYAPGDIATDIMADMLSTQADRLVRRIALARIGTPDEVADAVVFLASERAAYITGAVLEISGGKYVVQNPWDAWPQASPGTRADQSS